MSKLSGNPLWERLSNLMKKWFCTRQLLSAQRVTRRGYAFSVKEKSMGYHRFTLPLRYQLQALER